MLVSQDRMQSPHAWGPHPWRVGRYSVDVTERCGLLVGIVGAQSQRRCHRRRCLRWCLLVMLAAWRSSLSAPGTVGCSSSSLAAPDLEGHRTRSTSRHRWPRPNPRSDEHQVGNGEVIGVGIGCCNRTDQLYEIK